LLHVVLNIASCLLALSTLILRRVVKNKGRNTIVLPLFSTSIIICWKIILHGELGLQFGFKSGHSTSLSAGVVKQTVDYYTTKGSHVRACYVDFSKAFDAFNCLKLYHPLDDDVDVCLVQLLAYWYSHQVVSVVWINTRSKSFSIGNGTKQGGVLSPYFISRYNLRQLFYYIFGCQF